VIPTLWLLVFCDPPPCPEDVGWKERLLYRGLQLLRPGFRHVFAVREAEAFDGWVVVNPHSGSLDVVEVPADGVFWWDGTPVNGGQWFDSLFILEGKGLVHLATAVGVSRCEFLPRGPLTCVSVVKHLLGWNRSGTTLTPWQLFQSLTRRAKAMGGMFGGGGGSPDTSAADEQRAQLAQEKEELRKKNQAKLANMRARTGGGRGSLLDFAGTAAGGQPADKLGG
jgi:hypothetical protein